MKYLKTNVRRKARGVRGEAGGKRQKIQRPFSKKGLFSLGRLKYKFLISVRLNFLTPHASRLTTGKLFLRKINVIKEGFCTSLGMLGVDVDRNPSHFWGLFFK